MDKYKDNSFKANFNAIESTVQAFLHFQLRFFGLVLMDNVLLTFRLEAVDSFRSYWRLFIHFEATCWYIAPFNFMTTLACD